MDENRISTGDAKSKRRNFLSLAVAATAGAVASVLAKNDEALAGHDGTNVFHLSEANFSPRTDRPTSLSANVDQTSATTAALMIQNGDGTSPKGWALAATGVPGSVGGILAVSSGGDALQAVNFGSGNGVSGTSASGSGPGVFGHSRGSGSGILGSSQSGPGVQGIGSTGNGVNGDSDQGAGVRGSSRSPLAAGVQGTNSSGGPGLFGSSASGTGVRGAGSQTGVEGNSGSGTGVLGISSSGVGVIGRGVGGGFFQATGAMAAGVDGFSPSGRGVSGHSSTGVGVLGQSGGSEPGVRGNNLASQTGGPGVEGRSESGPGVQGFANATSPVVDGSGVLGRGSALWPGVRGVNSAGQAPGVDGTTLVPFGTGVFGQCRADNGFAVRGINHATGPAASFTNSNPSNAAPAVEGVTSGNGPGVRGSSTSGPGIQGVASQTGPGVEGFASTGAQPGVTGRPGVVGHASSTNSGVRGQSNALGPGVIGEQLGPGGFAIWANAAQSGAIGLRTGNAQGGIALDVAGRARFTTAGSATVPAKADTQVVSNPAVQANSNVIVTLTSDPGDAQIAWVERIAASGFVLHMTKKVGAPTTFAYLITESA